jgi:hypothetical protein
MSLNKDLNQYLFVTWSSMSFKNYWAKNSTTEIDSFQKKTTRASRELNIFWGLIKITW